MGSPQTAREALIAELIGDVDALIIRAEALRSALPDAANEAAAKVRHSGERAAEDIGAAAAKLARELTGHGEKVVQGVQSAARDAQAAAKVVDRSARRFALLAAAMGLAGGVLGGILAGLFLSRHFFGV
ncbi:hypothetical protein LJJ21_004738 [Salmonella enterica]|nr:hypothetical protein [Salmonella enterica]